MQHPNSGISATMNAIIIKNWDWKSILNRLYEGLYRTDLYELHALK